MDRANGLSSQYQYDPAGHLTLLRHIKQGKTLGHFAYTLDARGNRTQALEALPKATTGTTTLDKDSAEVKYPLGSWSTVGSYKETTNFTATAGLPSLD
jgi:hypothetical protein